MQEGFLLTSTMAGVFFRYCRRYKIEHYEDRVALVRRLVARGDAQYLRDAEQFMEGKNVLKVRKRSNE